MANLLDNNGALESCLLGVVTFELNSGLVVANAVCGCGRVVANLLRN